MDKRYQKAEELIRKAFFAMLGEMPVYKITVSELCRRTNINRGTFYLHYQDCYELIEVLSNEIVKLFLPYVENICKNRDEIETNVISMLQILTENSDAARLIQSSDMCREIINRRFRAVVQENWKRLSNISDVEADIIYSYISGGVFAVVNDVKFGRDNAEGEAEANYECICRLIINGLSAFVH